MTTFTYFAQHTWEVFKVYMLLNSDSQSNKLWLQYLVYKKKLCSNIKRYLNKVLTGGRVVQRRLGIWTVICRPVTNWVHTVRTRYSRFLRYTIKNNLPFRVLQVFKFLQDKTIYVVVHETFVKKFGIAIEGECIK